MQNGTPHTPQGQPLPADWRAQARARAESAEAAYLNRLQTAWQTKKPEGPAIRACRLMPLGPN